MNPSRRSVAPVRKLVAAIVGTIAVFVMLFGLGMSSWPIVALGAAMLALAIGLALINVVRRGGRAWVAGTAHVVSASEPPASSAYGRCELQLVVAAPGLQASAVKVRDPRVPVAKWPDAGATLPVTVAVDDMRHVRIQWDEVMTHSEAMEEPEVYADPLRDLPVDDLLPEPEAPPWVARDRQQWRRPESEAEPVTADLSGQLGDLRERPVVVRDAPGGPIVLEGTVVDADARPSTVPRRTRPSPRPSPRPRPQPAEPSPESSAEAAAPERSADADPDTDPAGATTAAATAAGATAAGATAAGVDTPERDEAGPGDRGAAPTDDPPGPTGAADSNGDDSETSHDGALQVPDDLSGLESDPTPSTPSGWDPSGSGPSGSGPSGSAATEQSSTAGSAAARPEADADAEVDLALDEPDQSTASSDPRAATDGSDASRSAGDQTGSPWYGDRPLTTGNDVAPEPPSGSVPPGSPNDESVGEAAQQFTDGDAPTEPVGHPSPEGAGGGAAVAALAQQVPTGAQAMDGGTAHSGARQGRLAGVKAAGAKAAGAVAAMAKAAGAKAVGMTSPGGTVPTRPVVAGPAAAGSVAAGSVAAGALVGASGSTGSGEDDPAASAADRARATETDDNRIDELLTAYPSARPGPAGAIHGVGITALVTDLDRSTRFYRDMLGFFEIDSGDGSAVLASGDTRLVLRTVHELSPTTGRLVYLNLEVGDVDAVYEELRDKGVTFLHEPRAVNRGDRLEMWAASFHDPDGHNIAVTQWRAVR